LKEERLSQHWPNKGHEDEDVDEQAKEAEKEQLSQRFFESLRKGGTQGGLQVGKRVMRRTGFKLIDYLIGGLIFETMRVVWDLF
jgi:hypothetical protein